MYNAGYLIEATRRTTGEPVQLTVTADALNDFLHWAACDAALEILAYLPVRI